MSSKDLALMNLRQVLGFLMWICNVTDEQILAIMAEVRHGK